MNVRFVLLGSDALLFSAIILMLVVIINASKRFLVRQAMFDIFKNKMAITTLCILTAYLCIAMLDSIHFQKALPQVSTEAEVQYDTSMTSLLDVLFGKRATIEEKTYSAPFALNSYLKEISGDGLQIYPKLKGTLKGINSRAQRNDDIAITLLQALCFSLLISLFILGLMTFSKSIWQAHSWQFYFTLCFIFTFILVSSVMLSSHYHILGTSKVGNDVFYQTIKSIRTGLVIGLITTIVTLPFAIFLGISAGYFGGRIDDVIQYLYITISSIPGVLLIAASVLSMQVFISNHPELFTTLMARSDARLISLCVILGLTGWTGLCRVLRAETLKLREIDYIQAAKVLGSSNYKIITKHILPNVMHLIIIAVVLDFSFLVLAEAVLSYIGVGVSPLTISWGNIINGARMELAREPIVWWPMLAAFIFMFLFVLSINLFADKVREAFDPRS